MKWNEILLAILAGAFGGFIFFSVGMKPLWASGLGFAFATMFALMLAYLNRTGPFKKTRKG
ncbi:MAG: hypothetical protein WC250_02535 [Candidatus Paceibacterota bacterium]|jgi:hypothetical protein